MSFFNRQLYKQKPAAWGPPSEVQSSIFANAERAGIDPAPIKQISCFWEKAGTPRNLISGLEGDGAVTWINGKASITNAQKIRFYNMSLAPGDHNKITFFLNATAPVRQDDVVRQIFGYGVSDGLRAQFTAYQSYTVDNRFAFEASENPLTYFTHTFRPELFVIRGIPTSSTDVNYMVFNKNQKAEYTRSYATSLTWDNSTIGDSATMRNVRDPGAFEELRLFLFYKGILTDSQIAHLSDNPYCLLHRIAPVFYSLPTGTVLPVPVNLAGEPGLNSITWTWQSGYLELRTSEEDVVRTSDLEIIKLENE